MNCLVVVSTYYRFPFRFRIWPVGADPLFVCACLRSAAPARESEEIRGRRFRLRLFTLQKYKRVSQRISLIGPLDRAPYGRLSIGELNLERKPSYDTTKVNKVNTELKFWVGESWTRSLSACVLTHAVTNALLGWYVLGTGQWGFW